MNLVGPYLIFIGDAKDALAAKTGQGIVDWRPERVIGQLRHSNCQADLGIADHTVASAVAAGAKTLVIGCVNPGGTFPSSWMTTLEAALAAGLDIASGLHTKLTDFEILVSAAEAGGRQLIDVRVPPAELPVGNGRNRTGK